MRKKTADFTSMLRPYIPPYTVVIATQAEQFFCTSVSPNPHSQQEDWDEDDDVDGGEYEFE